MHLCVLFCEKGNIWFHLILSIKFLKKIINESMMRIFIFGEI